MNANSAVGSLATSFFLRPPSLAWPKGKSFTNADLDLAATKTLQVRVSPLCPFDHECLLHISESSFLGP